MLAIAALCHEAIVLSSHHTIEPSSHCVVTKEGMMDHVRNMCEKGIESIINTTHPWDDEKESETTLAKVGSTPQDQGGNYGDNDDNNDNNKRCEELFFDFVNGEAHGYGPVQVDSEGSIRWRRQKRDCCRQWRRRFVMMMAMMMMMMMMMKW